MHPQKQHVKSFALYRPPLQENTHGICTTPAAVLVDDNDSAPCITHIVLAAPRRLYPQRFPPPRGSAFAPDPPPYPPPNPPPPPYPRPPRPRPPPPPPPPIVMAYCCSCEGTCWLASRKMPTSALERRTLSTEKKLMALPEAPARPVRPIRCT